MNYRDTSLFAIEHAASRNDLSWSRDSPSASWGLVSSASRRWRSCLDRPCAIWHVLFGINMLAHVDILGWRQREGRLTLLTRRGAAGARLVARGGRLPGRDRERERDAEPPNGRRRRGRSAGKAPRREQFTPPTAPTLFLLRMQQTCSIARGWGPLRRPNRPTGGTAMPLLRHRCIKPMRRERGREGHMQQCFLLVCR